MSLRLAVSVIAITLAITYIANASIVDYGPPQDALGHWKFDLYDFSGNQRGTVANPLEFSNVFSGAVVDPRARTWTLLNTTDSVNSVQSGTWITGRTWSLLNSTDGERGRAQ